MSGLATDVLDGRILIVDDNAANAELLEMMPRVAGYTRITAVREVFAALTPVRPYKDPWSVDGAPAFITDNSGKHFDPTLVDLFNRIFGEIPDIRNQFPDPL